MKFIFIAIIFFLVSVYSTSCKDKVDLDLDCQVITFDFTYFLNAVKIKTEETDYFDYIVILCDKIKKMDMIHTSIQVRMPRLLHGIKLDIWYDKVILREIKRHEKYQYEIVYWYNLGENLYCYYIFILSETGRIEYVVKSNSINYRNESGEVNEDVVIFICDS